jgi:site-specific recombinase XerD
MDIFLPQDVVERMQQRTASRVRHTFATLALQKGISLAAVQRILGHDRLHLIVC